VLDSSQHELGSGGDIRRFRTVNQDSAKKIGDRHVNARCPKVGDENVPTSGIELHLSRRSPTAARLVPALDRQPCRLQIGKPVRHHGTA
jgi:hypothetical protein